MRHDGQLDEDRFAATLTPAELAHLDGCIECRVRVREARLRASDDPSGDSEPPSEPPGRRLTRGEAFRRWIVAGELGRGGMGCVYLAHDDRGRPVAIKTLRFAGGQRSQRFRREGRVQHELRHPHVVRVVEFVEDRDGIAIVMEYVDGPSLRARLACGRPTFDQADHLALGIFAGVAHAHAEGLVHRDLKPDNILLADGGDGTYVPKIADFGLVKVLDGAATRHTRTGMAFGSLGYVAPEQLRAPHLVQASADIFSLGAILYELTTGVRAFDGFHRLRPVHEVAPDVPERMARAIEFALRYEAADRPPDVATLEAIWRGVPPGTPRERPRTALWSNSDMDAVPRRRFTPATRRRRPMPGWVIFADAAIGVAAIAWFQLHPRPCPGPLMPLAVGNTWTYRVTDPASGEFLFDKVNTLDGYGPVPGRPGVEGYHQDRRDGVRTMHRWLARDEDDEAVVWLFDDFTQPDGTHVGGVAFSPHRQRVSEACRIRWEGATWTEEYYETRVDPVSHLPITRPHVVRWTVEDVDDPVRVPAGEFVAVRFRRQDPAAGEDALYWFAPGVGKVLEHGSKEHEELVGFHVSAADPP